jgi:hypothetical protein
MIRPSLSRATTPTPASPVWGTKDPLHFTRPGGGGSHRALLVVSLRITVPCFLLSHGKHGAFPLPHTLSLAGSSSENVDCMAQRAWTASEMLIGPAWCVILLCTAHVFHNNSLTWSLTKSEHWSSSSSIQSGPVYLNCDSAGSCQ